MLSVYSTTPNQKLQMDRGSSSGVIASSSASEDLNNDKLDLSLSPQTTMYKNQKVRM